MVKKVRDYVILLVLLPGTILFGSWFLENENYYLISLLVIAYTLIPYLLHFENRMPKVREIVIIATMTALAVAGRGLFYFFPEVKPVSAIVIITAVAFGREVGVITGALAAFCSNFLMGQGPWTPYQMYAWAVIAFVAGTVYQKGLPRNRVGFSIFGSILVVLIYGFIMNGESILFMGVHTIRGAIAVYMAGLPFDLIHGISTGIFLFLLYKPILKKLTRMQVKYGW